MEYNPKKKKIVLQKELSNLDKLVLKFIKILEKYMDYVIVSGYVSILLGRTRATEDVDIFIKKVPEKQFLNLYQELKKEGFWCINTENGKEMFNYLQEGLAIRFAKKGKIVPNFEIKFPKRKIDEEKFKDLIVVKIHNKVLKISSLERQIAFKIFT